LIIPDVDGVSAARIDLVIGEMIATPGRSAWSVVRPNPDRRCSARDAVDIKTQLRSEWTPLVFGEKRAFSTATERLSSDQVGCRL
jgi:hypothetical protein